MKAPTTEAERKSLSSYVRLLKEKIYALESLLSHRRTKDCLTARREARIEAALDKITAVHEELRQRKLYEHADAVRKILDDENAKPLRAIEAEARQAATQSMVDILLVGAHRADEVDAFHRILKAAVPPKQLRQLDIG